MVFSALDASALSLQLENSGSLLVMSNLNVTVQYNLTNGLASFSWQNQRVISQFYSGVGLSTGYLKGTNYATWTYSQTASNQVLVTAEGKGNPSMLQYFHVRSNQQLPDSTKDERHKSKRQLDGACRGGRDRRR